MKNDSKDAQREIVEVGAFIPTPDVVAVMAYHYWCERGKPTGSPDEDWLRAEVQIRHDRTPGSVV